MRTGTRIAGRFVLGPATGSGAAAIVHRAKDTVTGGDVALKVMRRGLELDARFEREARILASVKDHGVVGYVSHGRVPDGRSFLALEWIEGVTLSERIAKTPLDAGVAVRITLRAARALGLVHAMGIVHRDVKPSNLMLRSDTRHDTGEPQSSLSRDDVVLMDFGIARAWDTSSTMTATNVFLGTPAYAAPEQAHAATVDARADVYALGCVLFECLAGRRVFEGRDLIAVLAKVAIDAAPPLSSFRPDLPPQLSALLAKTLSKSPADRAVDGAAFAEALAAIPRVSGSAAEITIAPAVHTEELRVRSIVVVDGIVTVKSRGPDDTVHGAELEVPDALRAIVHRHGGTLELLVNGCAIITFAVSGATEQALSAARCAMASSEALRGHPIAVATGRAEVARGAALGAVIDRAVALLELARRDSHRGVRIDAETVALLGRRLDLEETTEGAWIRALSSRYTPSSLGERWSCVGRTAEIDMLVAAFDACVEDSAARAVVVTAPPGMGKSRLADEALKRITSRDPKKDGPPLILLVPAQADRTRSPLSLASEIVRAAVGVADPELEGEIQPKVARRLKQTSLPDPNRTATFIAELVGAPIESPPSELVAAREDPWVLGEQLRDAFIDWLGAEVARRPVIVVVDDLHWADDASIRLLDTALERLSDRPLLVVALARPDIDTRFPRLFAGRSALKLPLEALRRGSAEALAREILGGDGDPELIRRIVDRAAGNALFLQELLRGVLEGRGETLPDSVLAILQARLDGIDPEARRVLRAACVLSGEFAPDAVAGLLDQPMAQVATMLDGLVRGEVLARKPHATATGRKLLFFRHALIRDAAYALIPDDERRTAHRAAAEWLVEHDTRDAQRIADHFERAGLRERAIPWLARAAREAMYAQDAGAILDIVARAKNAGATGPTLGVLRATESAALAWRGDWPAVESACTDALDLLARSHPLRIGAISGLVVSASMTGKGDGLVRLIGELRAFPLGDKLDRSTAFATHAVAAGLTIAGQRRLARELCTPLLQLPPDDSIAHASMLLSRGVLDEMDGLPMVLSFAAYREAALLYARSRNSFGMASAKRYQARIYIAVGAWARALETLPEVVALTKQVGGGVHVAFAHNLLAWSLVGAGRADEALALLREVEPQLGGSPLATGQHATVTALAALANDDLDLADRSARTADEGQGMLGPSRVHALVLRGEVAQRRGDATGALAFAQSSWELFTVTGAPAATEAPLRALLVAALRATGDEAAANQAYEEARVRWTERTAGLPADALP